MCGINAIYDIENNIIDKRALVCFMNDQMVHRGPDDQGLFCEGPISMGMRRLSIIDLEGGRQPLFNEDRTLALVFNGEIYNYKEIMERLTSMGHRFNTKTDCECILHLYEEKGERCLEDLRGMFAFVLWDRNRGRLFAARDRIGIKPLYMSRVRGVLWLSSELKAIVGGAGISPTLRPSAILQQMVFSYPVHPRHTIVEEIDRVLPGEYIVADSSGVKFFRYWKPTFGGESGTGEMGDDELIRMLENAVAIHLRSDVPVGILLSGGIDSSAIAAMAARSGSEITALCAGYRDFSAVDERLQAHATARALGLPHIDVILDARSYGDRFDRLVNYCDEPVGDIAAMPQWGLYREARKLGFKVLLSGIGGDEVFFGYPVWNEIGAQCTSLTEQQFRGWYGFREEGRTRDYSDMAVRVSGAELSSDLEGADECLRTTMEGVPQGPDSMYAMIFGTYLVNNGCLLSDKLGMGCSVEVRAPLLDHKLVDAILGLPLRKRFERGASKMLLKKLLKGLVPNAVLGGQKQGFTPPTIYVDRLVAERYDIIRAGILASKGFIKPAELDVLFSKHVALPWLQSERIRSRLGIPRVGWFLFRLLAMESWYSVLSETIYQARQKLPMGQEGWLTVS